MAAWQEQDLAGYGVRGRVSRAVIHCRRAPAVEVPRNKVASLAQRPWAVLRRTRPGLLNLGSAEKTHESRLEWVGGGGGGLGSGRLEAT